MENQETDSRIAARSESADEDLIWKAHVLDVQRFEGTHAEYCELHGLKLGQLQRYKRKFGVSRKYRKDKPKAFAKVECLEAAEIEPAIPARECQPAALPDPRWMAELIMALTSCR